MTMSIGERIKTRRKELKISQRDLADRIGYTNHSTITRIEKNEVDLPQSRLKQFAEVLDMPLSHLMGWDAEPEDLGALAANVLKNPKLFKLVQNYMSLSEADQNTLDILAETLSANKKS